MKRREGEKAFLFLIVTGPGFLETDWKRPFIFWRFARLTDSKDLFVGTSAPGIVKSRHWVKHEHGSFII